MSTSAMRFDPFTDLPPDGAEVAIEGRLFRYYSDQGWWRVESSPVVGEEHRLARTFSDEGIVTATYWAESPAGVAYQRGDR